MTTVSATIVAMAVLSAVGLLPTMGLVGLRWITFPLVPLAGAVIAALAATVFVAVGGTFMVWFVALAALGAGLTGLAWWKWPDRRPWTAEPGSTARNNTAQHRLVGALGALGIVAACAWCLRDLATPTVGFDARALWLTRSGWFLHSHQQVLTTLRSPALVLGQSAYPPLVSASGAVAWSVTGNHTLRLGVVVIALLNTCALATAAFAVVEFGRRFSSKLSPPEHRQPNNLASIAPMLAGVVAAVLLIFISFGITEPFMTNGYADPIWSLAALGAVVYGLQMTGGRSEHGVVAILLLTAGMSKNEGVVTAAVLIVLVALRQLSTRFADRGSRTEPPSRWWRVPIAIGVAELAAVGAWPVVMRVIGARGQSSPLSTPSEMVSRARATYDGFVPYLHVLLWAAPIALIGGLVLSGVRSRSGAANDSWGWAGLASGLLAVAGALIVGTSAIEPWLATTVHRVTEFPALTGWWIVAVWAVVASGAPAAALQPTANPDPEGLPAHLSSRTTDRVPEPVRAPSV